MKILLVITVIILAIVYAFSQSEISIDGQYVVLKKNQEYGDQRL